MHDRLNLRKEAVWAALVLAAAVLLPARAGWCTTARDFLDQAKKLNQTTRKWRDRTQDLKLEITDRRGNTRERELRIYYKKYDGDRSRSILFFQSPPDVKGTGFLQWVDPHSENQQWLYLPELKRVRQISGSSNRESFMGTDFSYDDLAIITEILDWTDEDAAATLESDALSDCGDSKCRVISFTPNKKDLAYGRIRLWIDAEFRQHRFEFLDKKGELLKVLEATDIRDVGNIPTAFRLTMTNVQSGTHTVVEFQDVKYDTGLSDSMFVQHQLEKGL